jgi:hypothetical protein
LQQRVAQVQASHANLSTKVAGLKASIQAMEEEVTRQARENPGLDIFSTIGIGVITGTYIAVRTVIPPVAWMADWIFPPDPPPPPNPLIASIQQARDEFTQSERHLADMTILATSMERGTKAIDAATKSMTLVQTMWRSFSRLLVNARETLADSQSQDTLIEVRVNLKDAFEQWNEAAKSAQGLLNQQQAPKT